MISSALSSEADRKHQGKDGDDDSDKKSRSKVRHRWSSEGLSGSAWTAKKRGDDDGDDWNDAENSARKAFESIAGEARAAFGEAGLAVLPERDSVSSSSSPSLSSPSKLLRSLVSRVASAVSSSLESRPSSLSAGVEAHGTCNGEKPRWKGAPCKGEAKMTWNVSDDDGQQKAHGSAVCDGFWSGMSWRNTEKCLGFSQIRATKGEWTMYKQCNGVEASKKGRSSSCPWGHGGRSKGIASWCHGGAAGAVTRKVEEEEKGFGGLPQQTMTVTK